MSHLMKQCAGEPDENPPERSSPVSPSLHGAQRRSQDDPGEVKQGGVSDGRGHERLSR